MIAWAPQDETGEAKWFGQVPRQQGANWLPDGLALADDGTGAQRCVPLAGH
jgi:hypothetical protein